jgi:hypothetical protein
MASSSNSPSAKRKRPTYEAEAQASTRGDTYYDDGNVLLVVQNVHYRVYRGILADLSPVFADMFKVPGRTLPDGSRTIELDDSAEDWRKMLKAIFQG